MVGGGGGDGLKGDYPWYYAPSAFLAFACGNIGLNLFNSWVMHPAEDDYPGHGKAGFRYPFFYTMFHMLASATAALIMQLTCQKPTTGSPYPTLSQLWDYKYQLVPIATLTVLNNGCNNLSLGLIALFINQVIKATGPAPTALFEYILIGKTYNMAIYTSVGLIIAGCILANYSSMLAGGSTQIMGVVWVCVSLVAAALRPVLQRIIISSDKTRGDAVKKAPLSVPQALFWDCGISFFGMAAVWLLSDEREGSIAYLTGNTSNPDSGWLALGCITFSSFLAFTFNFATYYFVLYTSALTLSVGSNGCKIFLIVLSMFTDNMLDVVSICGVLLVVASIGMYTYFQHQFNVEQKAKAAASMAAPLNPKADEKTPLAGKV